MNTMDINEAKKIILNHVSDWDPEVLRNAAQHAIAGGSAWEFEGRPHDEAEMKAFSAAFDEIKEAPSDAARTGNESIAYWRVACSANQSARSRNLIGLTVAEPESALYCLLAATVYLEAMGEPFPDVLSCLEKGTSVEDLTQSIENAIRDCLT